MKKFIFFLMLLSVNYCYAQKKNNGSYIMKNATEDVRSSFKRMVYLFSTKGKKAAIQLKNGEIKEFKILSETEMKDFVNALDEIGLITPNASEMLFSIAKDTTNSFNVRSTAAKLYGYINKKEK